jgi:hypothetical protein
VDVSTADFIVHALPASLTHEGSRAAILDAGRLEHGRKLMIKSIAVAAFALACATSAQAMSPVPLHQPDSLHTEVAYGCGREGHEFVGSAWPEPPFARPAGACGGVEALALGGATTD